MRRADGRTIYCAYLARLNAQDWQNLGEFVDPAVIRNDEPLGLSGYREMLIKDFETISDLRFALVFSICDAAAIGAIVKFNCHPKDNFMGLPTNGRRIVFHENFFCEFQNGKIFRVHSVIDKGAIEKQLTAGDQDQQRQ